MALQYYQYETTEICSDPGTYELLQKFSSPNINMLRQPEQGQALIEHLYGRKSLSLVKQSHMKEKFQLVIIFFSSYGNSSMDLDEAFNRAIEEYRMFIKLEPDGREHYCSCSHPINQLYYIINNTNGNILVVGSECIKKLCPEEFQDSMKSLNRAFRSCKQCKTFHKTTTMISGLCSKCSQVFPHKGKKACQKCFRFRISESWKNLCKECYKSRQETRYIEPLNDRKICISCSQSFIPLKTSYTKCQECYDESKDSKKKICLSCHQPFYPIQEWFPRCLKCYRLKGY